MPDQVPSAAAPPPPPPVPSEVSSSQQPVQQPAQQRLTPPVVVKPSLSESTVSRNKEARQSELEAKRQAKKDAKRAERRAKAAAAAKKRQGAEQDDLESIASNLSVAFDSDTESIMSIQGEDPAPDSVQEMLKNAVQGHYDPKAWEKPL